MNIDYSDLRNYLDKNYHYSSFHGGAAETEHSLIIHTHEHQKNKVKILADSKYDFRAEINNDEKIIRKLDIKFLYSPESSEKIKKLIKFDKKIKNKKIFPITSPGQRNHIKNKVLFPLMSNWEVVFITLLEGEIIRGLISDFSRYEIIVNLKGGIPVTIMRHAVYDIRDKKKKSWLKKSN
jgi:hypothetical protein